MTAYLPNRNDIVWLDFEPKKGKEIGKYRPAFILSSKQYNKKTGNLICCPISTSIRGAESEVLVTNLNEKSVIATSIIQTLSWKARSCKFIAKAEDNVFNDVIIRILSFIGAEEVIQNIISS